MGNIGDRLLETDPRRIQLTIWPSATAAAIAWKGARVPAGTRRPTRGSFRPNPSVRSLGSARLLLFSCPLGPRYRNGDDPALRRRRRQLALCHGSSHPGGGPRSRFISWHCDHADRRGRTSACRRLRSPRDPRRGDRVRHGAIVPAARLAPRHGRLQNFDRRLAEQEPTSALRRLRAGCLRPRGSELATEPPAARATQLVRHRDARPS